MTFSKDATYISLEQASAKYGISKKVLLDQINSGRLPVVKLMTGEVLVADQHIDLSLNVKREAFEHLRNKPIGIREAAKKYDVWSGTLASWTKAGYIKILQENKLRGQKKLVDEADVAYCASVYKAKYDFYNGQMSGVRIFDNDGNPYQAKYPKMAADRRIERQQKRTDVNS